MSLDKRDFGQYKALFASYLDIQKELDIDQLSEREVYGRWKSFIYKWYAFLYHRLMGIL